jgi:hypothetical protein
MTASIYRAALCPLAIGLTLALSGCGALSNRTSKTDIQQKSKMDESFAERLRPNSDRRSGLEKKAFSSMKVDESRFSSKTYKKSAYDPKIYNPSQRSRDPEKIFEGRSEMAETGVSRFAGQESDAANKVNPTSTSRFQSSRSRNEGASFRESDRVAGTGENLAGVKAQKNAERPVIIKRPEDEMTPTEVRQLLGKD